MWKPEYAANRRRKGESDPEYRARRAAQGARESDENKEYMREYYEANKDRFRQYRIDHREERNAKRRARYAADAEYRERCRESARQRDKGVRRDARLQSQFGITAVEYDRLREQQGGGCAICGAVSSDRGGRRLHIDHCHRSGAVRGLLCTNCNQGIGKFADDPSLLRRAAAYLEDQRAVGDLGGHE